MIRWETKKRIWIVSRCRWRWLPWREMNTYPDTFMCGWLFAMIEFLDKEWLDYCERKGGGLLRTMEWVAEEIAKESEGV